VDGAPLPGGDGGKGEEEDEEEDEPSHTVGDPGAGDGNSGARRSAAQMERAKGRDADDPPMP
jgi:hypothetical protein